MALTSYAMVGGGKRPQKMPSAPTILVAHYVGACGIHDSYSYAGLLCGSYEPKMSSYGHIDRIIYTKITCIITAFLQPFRVR